MRKPVCPCNECGKTKIIGAHPRCDGYNDFRKELTEYNDSLRDAKLKNSIANGVYKFQYNSLSKQIYK